MPYNELNNQIYKRISKDIAGPSARHRLIYYALDETILSNELFLRFPDWLEQEFGDNEGNKLHWIRQHLYFFCLFLIRLFYEETDGRSYNPFIQSKLDLSRRLDDDIFSACENYGLFDQIGPDSHPRFNIQRLLVECWIFMKGPTSEIWRTLIPLIRSLPNVQDIDEFDDYIEEFFADHANIPFSLDYLSEKKDKDFVESIKCICVDSGISSDSWKQHIKKAWNQHCHGNSANVGWVIDTTPGRMRFFLAIRDLTLLYGRRAIQFYQDGRTSKYELKHDPYERLLEGAVRYRFLSFTPRALQEMQKEAENIGIDPDASFEVRYGKTTRGEVQKMVGLRLGSVIAQEPFVFRWPARKLYASLLSQETQQVSSPKLILVWPDEDKALPQLKWGNLFLDDCVDCSEKCEVLTADKNYYLPVQIVSIPGDRLSGIQPLVWIENEKEYEIIRIGAKPILDLVNADSNITMVDSDVQICFEDGPLVLHVRNIPNDQFISDEDINIVSDAEYHLNVYETGQFLTIPHSLEVKCRYRPSGSVIRLIRFPSAIRNVVLGTDAVNGWEWRDDDVDWSNKDYLTQFVAEHRFALKGILTSPEGKRFSLTKPLNSAKIWWRGSGINYGQVTGGKKDFYSLSELRSYYLCVWSPEPVELKFGEEIIAELPCGYSETELYTLIRPDYGQEQFDEVRTLFAANIIVAEIMQRPDRPCLGQSGEIPMIYFPSNFSLGPEDYRIVHFSEQGLLAPLRIENCDKYVQEKANLISIDDQNCGYWLVLVQTDREYNHLLYFCLDRDKHIEDVLEVRPSPRIQVEQLLLGEQYLDLEDNERSKKLEKAAALLDILETQRKIGEFPKAVLAYTITNRSHLNVATLSLKEEFDEFFRDNCDLDHLCDTLQILLDHSINVFAQRGWCKDALNMILKACARKLRC